MNREKHAASFAVEVAAQLGAAASPILDYGVTKGARFTLADRRVEVLVARGFEIEVGLSLPGFPPQAGVTYAPAGLYARAKLLDDGYAPTRVLANVDAFDETFLVLGSGAREVLDNLRANGLAALCQASDLCPDLNAVKFVAGQPPEPWLHIRARPCAGHTGSDDEQPLNHESAVRAVNATVALATHLERNWSAPCNGGP